MSRTPEDVLRSVLASEADSLEFAGDGLTKIRARLGRPAPWRRPVFALGAVVAVAAGVALAVVLQQPDGNARILPQPFATGSPATQPSPQAVPTDSPAAQPPAPAVFLSAGTQPDGLVVYDSTTGAKLRRLTTWQPGGGDGAWSVSTDGWVYFTRGQGTCSSGIERIKLDGTGEQQLYNGAAGPADEVAVSPDGRSVAYVRADCTNSATDLVVRSIATGDERIIAGPRLNSPGLTAPVSVGWAPDGSTVIWTDQRTHLVHLTRVAGHSDRTIEPSPGCELTASAPWTDYGVVVAENCGNTGNPSVTLQLAGMAGFTKLATLPQRGGCAQIDRLSAQGTNLLFFVDLPCWYGPVYPSNELYRFVDGTLHTIPTTAGGGSFAW